MNGKETQSQVVQDPGLTVDIRTENWPQDTGSLLKKLITVLVPSAKLDGESVLIPRKVLNTRVELYQVLKAVLQLEGADGEPIFPDIEPTLQQLRVALRDVDLDSIKTVFENVEGLKDVFSDPQNVEILSTIFAQGPVVKICEIINGFYGKKDENRCILNLKTNFPKVTDEFNDFISSEYNLRAKVEIPSGINKDDKNILSNAYRTLFKLITESLNEQIKQGLRGKIDGCKIGEIDAILPFLGLDYNGITIHTKHDRNSPFRIVIPVKKNNNTFTVEEIGITGEDKNDNYARRINARIDFLKKIAKS